MVLSKNDVRLMGLKSLGPVQESYRARYKYYFKLAQYGWNIAHGQAGTKYPDQVQNDNPPSLLQQGREYAIHSRTFIWGKRINRPKKILRNFLLEKSFYSVEEFMTVDS
jgi:hypothetical protein